MIRFLTILTILAFSVSQSFATPLDLVVTSGSLETSATIGGPTTVDDLVAAAMPLSTSSTAVLDSTSSSATYDFTNAGGVASFDIHSVTQALVADNISSGLSSHAIGTIFFQLNEAADYSVSGAYSGSSSDMPNLDYESFWRLFDADNSSFVFAESEFSLQTASHVVNGLDDGNAGSSLLIGSSTGTLLPGNYRMEYRLNLTNLGFELGSGNAAGFANLTLTRVIPEPASAVLMLLCLGATFSCRRPNRNQATF